MQNRFGVFVLLTVLVCGCESDKSAPKTSGAGSTPKADSQPSSEWGGLIVQTAGVPLEQASRAVILLHGYGASSDDLAPLAKTIGEGKSIAFLFPQGPFKVTKTHFAWSRQSDEHLEKSRGQIVQIIKKIHEKNPECKVSVGGFSQGGTVAASLLDDPEAKVESVILYSTKNNFWREPASTETKTRVFLSHGKNDHILPFSEAESLKSELEKRGYHVDWHPFDGQHELTPELIEATKEFLAATPKEAV